MENKSLKIKITVIFSVLLVAVTVILLMIFFAGKKSFTVSFELNGGTLISGSLEQSVTRGQDATPPTVVKDGAYLHSWDKSYKNITKDVVIEAVWEYETTPGIIYSSSSNQNFAEISGSYDYIRGEVYLGAYFGDKKILGIKNDAFKNRTGITKVYLLEGLISIGDNAFAGCTGITEMNIPETVVRIGAGAFKGCESLERIVLSEGLLEIGEGAFEGCGELKEIVLPSTLTKIDPDAFKGCSSLVEIVIPESVTTIGRGAFENCVSLESVTLNDGLLEIGAGAFMGCEKLAQISLPSSVVSVGANAFLGCAEIKIKINWLDRIKVDKWGDEWSNGATIEWDGGTLIPIHPDKRPGLQPDGLIKGDKPIKPEAEEK